MAYKWTCAGILAVALASSSALADTRIVGKSGTDSPTCGSTGVAPCLTIGTALSNAVTGGGFARVVIASNGVFQEAVTITTAAEITVANGGFVVLAPPSGGVGITINAGTSDSIRIYNLYFGGGSGAALNAIAFNGGSRLELHNVQVRGFGGPALNLTPSGGTSSDVLIVDSDIAENSNSCVLLQPNGIAGNGYIINSRIHNCSTLGVRADSQNTTGFVKILLSRSLVYGVGATAVSAASGTAGGTARVFIEDSDISAASNGIVANGAKAQLVLNRSSVTGNSLGSNAVGGGVVYSYGNNVLQFNTNNGPAPTPVALQ